MKQITETSEQHLKKMFDALSEIQVSGRDVFRMATAISLIEEIFKQINTPPEKGEIEKED